MAMQAKVNGTVESMLQDDGRAQMDIPPSYDQYRIGIIYMLEELQTIWEVYP